ncbi:MAG: VanZ family protein, partial [Bdellovibrionota bacterium]
RRAGSTVFDARRQIFWFGILSAVALLPAFAQLPLPEERIHLLLYGTYAVFCWWHLPVSRRFLSATLVAFTVGFFEEWIQRYVPERHFDWRDIGLNTLGAVTGLSIWILARRLSQSFKK